AAHAIARRRWMTARQRGPMAAQAFVAIVRGLIGRLAVRIVASAARQPIGALLPTYAAPQLLRLADHFQRRVVARIADEHREGLFERVAGHEIVPVFLRIENACVSLKMALLADAVSGVRREAARVDNIGARRLGYMLRGRSVAALARDAFFGDRRILVPVSRPLHEARLSRVAQQALEPDWAIEIRSRVVLVARRHDPRLLLHLVGNGRLEKIIADLHQVTERSVPRADNVGYCVFPRKTASRNSLAHSVARIAHSELGSGCGMKQFAIGLRRG